MDGYYWIRVFDYDRERDSSDESILLESDKGVMLDEFYLRDVTGGRDEVKSVVRERYKGNTPNEIKFAKPKKGKSGVYAIVMDSDNFFYDRFHATVDTYCFWCHRPVKGKAREFPRSYIGNDDEGYYAPNDDRFCDLTKTAYFCDHDCKSIYLSSLNHEGEFQVKEQGEKGDIFGYIYLIYNRAKDAYYIGQTRFMPFFRWQEHIKSGEKGDIKDLTFSVITEVIRNKGQSEDKNQLYLNSLEAWWIKKYQEEGHQVVNISRPKITIEHLKQRFEEMVSGL